MCSTTGFHADALRANVRGESRQRHARATLADDDSSGRIQPNQVEEVVPRSIGTNRMGRTGAQEASAPELARLCERLPPSTFCYRSNIDGQCQRGFNSRLPVASTRTLYTSKWWCRWLF